MDRVFLDANVLFSAAYRPDSGIIKLWKLDIGLLTSVYALEEARINLETEEQRERLDFLAKDMQIVTASIDLRLPKGIPLPEKDIPILKAAIAAKATHLLTGDISHFGKYFGKTMSGVLIEPPGDYIRKQE